MKCEFSQCGIEFEPKSPRQKYCSPTHRVYAQREAEGLQVGVGAGRPKGAKNKPKIDTLHVEDLTFSAQRAGPKFDKPKLLPGATEPITFSGIEYMAANQESYDGPKLPANYTADEPGQFTMPKDGQEAKKRTAEFLTTLQDNSDVQSKIKELEKEQQAYPSHVTSEIGRRVWRSDIQKKINELKSQLK